MKVFFLIPSMARGGAENQVLLLANALAQRGHEVAVVPLTGGGELEKELRGVRLLPLGKRSRAGLPLALARLVRLVRAERPDILHGYLPTANILASLAGRFCPATRIVFGMRVSNMRLGKLGPASRLAYALDRRLAARADLVIVNSHAGLAQAEAQGYPPDRLAVVHNAVNTLHCLAEPGAADLLRARWGVGPDQRLVGLAARLDPMKDQLGFVRAARLVLAKRPDVRFVLVGGGVPDYARRVERLVTELGLRDRIVLAGQRSDMGAVYAALDVLCLASAYGEGFPNVVAEALCCGTPCVVTDVGDSALLAGRAGEAGLVAPPGDPEALARGLLAMLARVEAGGDSLGRQARAGVAAFTPEELAQRSEELFKQVLRP